MKNQHDGDHSHDQRLLELKSLLFGEEKNKIENIEPLVDTKMRDPKILGENFHQALNHSSTHHKESLSQELDPLIEDGISNSIKKNPENIINILTPIIGPAIRKSVADALKKFIENTNHMLENSFSPKHIKWRLQSWFSGTSYSDVVLANAYAYSVEDILLIDKNSGILIASAHHPNQSKLDKDEDLVSGMLTAIRQFTADTMSNSTENSLDRLEFGNSTILVKEGLHAYIAAVIEGTPNSELENFFIELNESLHLHNYPFENPQEKSLIKEKLTSGLQTKHKPHEIESASETSKQLKSKIILTTIALAILSIIGWNFYNSALLQQQQKLVDQFISDVDMTAGFMVVHQELINDRFIVKAFKDIHTEIPKKQLVELQNKIHPKKITLIWKPYVSTEKHMVLEQLKQQVDIPPSLKLALKGNILNISGTSSIATKQQVDEFLKKQPNRPQTNTSKWFVSPNKLK